MLFCRSFRSAAAIADGSRLDDGGLDDRGLDDRAPGGRLSSTDLRAAGEVLAPLARRCGADLHQFFTEIALGAEVDALDPRNGATAHHEGEASINHLMAARAEQVMIVSDSSKLGQRAFARVCAVDEIGVLVTDRDARPDLLAAFTERGIRVITA